MSVRRPMAAVSFEVISSLLMDGGQDAAFRPPSAPKGTGLGQINHGSIANGGFVSLTPMAPAVSDHLSKCRFQGTPMSRSSCGPRPTL